MRILLGNLNTKQIQQRLGITLPEEDVSTLDSMRQEKAENIAPDKWHCFDIPFTMVCGSMETATKVYEILKPYSSQMNEPLQISIYK
jgi:Mg2+/Co2+ transporter CorB